MGTCLSSAAYEKWHKKVNRKHNDLGEYGKPTILSASDYAFGPFIAEGGMGTVYAGICVSNRSFVALKFFGYTEKEPRDSDIDREISLLMAVHGIEGVVQIKGVFMDSKTGRVGSPGEKKWNQEYPVIVMEYLDGGAIYDVINEREKISEADLKRIFSRFITALHGMHSRGYIHNDLKLENVMLESQTDDSIVKIIDLGFMNYLPPGTKKITGKGVKGTPGYVAPETHSQYEYSYKTDMWQTGCLLYSMLSGIGPFSSKDVPQTMRGEYFPMIGHCWDGISDKAKDLVKQLLVLSPDLRLSTEQVLCHPWITDAAPDIYLGDNYVSRVKQLSLRQKMQKFFLNNDIAEKNRLRTDHVKHVLKGCLHKYKTATTIKRISFSLPPLSQSTNSPYIFDSKGSNRVQNIGPNSLVGTTVSVSPLHGCRQSRHSAESVKSDVSSESGMNLRRWTRYSQDTYDQKMNNFKELMVSLINEQQGANGVENATVAHKTRRGVEYDVFVDVLCDAGLADLACREVFSMFDIGNNGVIDMKDFLLTMLALQASSYSASLVASTTSSSPAHGSSDDVVSLYFSIFDIDDSGYIELKDFKVALSCLLDMAPVVPSHQAQQVVQELRPLPLHPLASTMSNEDAQFSLPATSSTPTSPVVRRMSISQVVALDEQQVEELFNAIDVNNSGRITMQEFKRFYETVIVISNESNAKSSTDSRCVWGDQL